MGNCCRRGSTSSLVWAGDDWESVGHGKLSPEKHHDHATIERQRLLGENMIGGFSSSSMPSGSSAREVKIKITKSELEEMLARINMQGLSMEEVFARFINSSSSGKNIEILDYNHHRSWKPALQSIPEVN